jgi:hypothetical protein
MGKMPMPLLGDIATASLAPGGRDGAAYGSAGPFQTLPPKVVT